MRRHHKKFFHRRKSSHRSYNQPVCHFCKNKIEGLPHFCKFCGKSHCYKHLLPEDHNCEGLKHPKQFSLNHPSSHGTRRTYEEDREEFKSPRIRFPRIRINKFFKALIIAILSFLLANYFLGRSLYDLFLFLEVIAWGYFSFILYKKAFHWANRVSMADDLSFFGLRLLGAIVTIGGIYFGFAVLLTSLLVRNSAPTIIPLACLLVGLILLGGFIAFRTNRRHHVVGIWKA